MPSSRPVGIPTSSTSALEGFQGDHSRPKTSMCSMFPVPFEMPLAAKSSLPKTGKYAAIVGGGARRRRRHLQARLRCAGCRDSGLMQAGLETGCSGPVRLPDTASFPGNRSSHDDLPRAFRDQGPRGRPGRPEDRHISAKPRRLTRTAGSPICTAPCRGSDRGIAVRARARPQFGVRRRPKKRRLAPYFGGT